MADGEARQGDLGGVHPLVGCQFDSSIINDQPAS
jgi:hypothetical protein